MLHACNAVDGTASKLYPGTGNNERFTRLLRENYAILGPMGAPGIDLLNTRFPVKVKSPKAPGGKPDLADVIYGIHRCCHAHGDELPAGFELIHDAAGPKRVTRILIERGKISAERPNDIRPCRSCSPLADKQGPSHHRPRRLLPHFGNEQLTINEWWGRAKDFPAIAAKEPSPNVKLDFGDWM